MLNLKIFIGCFMTFISNPLMTILFLALSFAFMFLQIANNLLKKKNDTKHTVNIMVDLPVIFLTSATLSLIFYIVLTLTWFSRDASKESYQNINTFLQTNFSKAQAVDGTFLKDYTFYPIKEMDKKRKFQDAVNVVYKDKKITYGEVDYLARLTRRLSK